MRFFVRPLKIYARTVAAACAALALAAATPAHAIVTSQFDVLLDLDNNPATGCTVSTANGPFKGVEQILVTTVDITQSPPKVISVAHQVCTNPGTGTFGPLTPINSPFAPPWPVGVGNGTSGSDVVESYLPLANLGAGAVIHLAFTAQVVGGTGAADATLTTTDMPGGPPILLSAEPIAAIPTLGELGLVLLALLLAGCAVRLVGKRGGGAARGALAGMLLLTLGLGLAWAASIVPDGTTGDWAGIPPIATDIIGDAPPNADLVAEFATIQSNVLFVRFDAIIVGLPKVTSTTPINGATGVSGSAPLTVNFNEPVAIDASSFTLDCPSGTPATFTVAPAAPGNAATYTLTPSPALPAGVTCAVNVVAAHIKDGEGLHPAANFGFSFTTDGPPTVTSTSPANGAANVPLNSKVTVNFSKAVNVTASAFKLECPTGTPQAFSIAPSPPGGATSFTLTPSALLPQGTTCTLTVVAAQVTDVAAATHMAADVTASFTTDAAPTVTTTVPASGATGVAINGTVTVNFSKAVNVTASAFKLECPTGTPETFTIAPAPPGGATSFTLTPSANLPAGTTCTATVVAAQVTDVSAGTHLGADFVFTFTTDTAPTVTTTTPAAAATQVPPNTTITVNFSKAVNVTASAFKLECPTGTPEAFTIAPAPPGGATSFTLTPSANLPASTACTVTVVAAQVTDVAAGTPLAADFVFTFTTGNPPTVTSTVPANGATAVLASTTVSFTFNHAVNVTATAFKLECPAGTPQAFTLSPAPPGNATTFTLTPTAPLPAGTVCTATAVAAQITDASSLHPTADDVITFTIDTPPTVSSTAPASGATSVPLNATVSFTFNKAVNVTAPGFKLECPTGTPVPFTLAPAPPGGVTTFTLTPSANLPAGVTCTATAVAAQVKDLAGTNLAADFAFSFTTDAAPTVTTTAPANGATSVPLNATVSFTFNKAVNITPPAFKLECPAGTPVAFTVAPAAPGGVVTFTLTPSAPLPAGVVCTATAVATQIKDLVGTNLAANFVFTFTLDVAPTVTATVPANGAINVSPSAPLSVTFSKAVNVTASAFTLQCPTGTPEAFTIAPAPPGGATSFTLTPTAPLPVATTCTATVVANQVTDVSAGTQLASNFVWSFTTGTPPTVSSTTPANGATNVLATAPISITFNRTVNVTGTAFTLACPTGTPEAFTLAPAPPGGVTTFTLTPTAPLPAGTVCTVTAVASQITDVASGVNMAANFVWSFTTDTAPTVTSTTPANGATAVPLNSTVSFTFNKAVNVTGTAFTLECPTGTPQAFTLSPAPPGGVTTFTLTPSANLPAGTVCTATAVAAQITDLAGTHLAANVAISFTTDTAPTVTSTVPANGATAVLASTTVTFTFNKAVNVTASAFTLACPTGTPEAFTLAPAPPGGVTSFTLTPTAPLPAGTVCTATAVASQIADLAGTHLAANDVISFTIDTPPTVTSTTPANGAINISPSAPVTVTFSKAVNVTATAFTLACPTGTPESFTLAPAPPGNATTFTLTPTAPLPASTTCTGTVVATQVSDAAGTQLASNFVWSFTTGTPPTVSSTNPANGATNVLATAPISITFNRTVNVTASAFTLACPTGTPEAFTLSPAPPGGVTTFTLTPTAALPAGTVCTVTAVASQITDAASGINMAANFVWSFTTDTAPTVTSTNPTSGATAVPLTTTVSFTFNKAVNVTATAFTLACPTGTPEAFTLSPAPPGGVTTFTLTPSANLPAGTVCTATAVASQITDLVGTHLAANVPVSFTTDTAPTVTSVNPANGATSVLATTTVTVNFSKAVNVTSSAFTLACPTGTPESFTIAPAPPGGATSFTLTPTANLPAGAVCTATVVASQVTDVSAGTPMAANFTWSFTIDTPPTVTSTNPANGATSVSPATTVSVTFNKAVNVTASAFTLACPTGTPESFTISPAPPGGATTFTLTPTANLPSDTTCTATVVATQVADIAGTPMAANFTWSFSTPPRAVNDTFPQNVIGNVSINSALIPYSVTTNDVFTLAVTITAFDATSVNGGTVTMTTNGAGIGQFTYNPAAGFTGTDTFTYTITNAHGSSTATVSIPVSGIIWFINNTAGAGDGRLASPFNSLAAFQAINDGGAHHPAANANIFLYDSATGYTGPVTLLNGQKLIGQDATSSLSAITTLTPGTASATLPATGGGSPNDVAITSAANTVTLGSGNTVWGMTLGNATGTALTGASVGSLKIRDMTINNTTGAAVSLANGALDAILNAVSAGGGTHGISLTTTTGSFDVEGGGASDPTNTTKGRTTAKSGGGTLTLGSGGTIQNATSAGVVLSSATSVTLRNMTIQNNGGAGVNTGGDGINASGSSSLTLDNDLITGQPGNAGLFASTLAGLAIQHTQISSNATNSGLSGTGIWNVTFGQATCSSGCPDGLSGTVTVANSIFETTFENAFGLVNRNASTLNLTATNCQFSNAGNIGLESTAQNTSNVTIDVTGSSVSSNPGGGIYYNGFDSSGGGKITVTNSTFDQNGSTGAADINVFHEGVGTTQSFDIESNTTRQTLVTGSSISIGVNLGASASATTVFEGKILNNTVGNAAVTDSGSDLNAGIAVENQGQGTMTVLLTGNTVKQTDDDGLFVIANATGTPGHINVTASGGNDFEVSPTDPNTNLGIELTSGGGGQADVICANITGNSKEIGNSGVAGIATTVGGASVIQLQGYTGAANNNAQIATFLTGTATTVSPGGQNFAGGGTVEAAPSACATPP